MARGIRLLGTKLKLVSAGVPPVYPAITLVNTDAAGGETASSSWCRPHSIILDWLQPGLPNPCMARQSTCRRAGSVE